jgi:ParB family chromosome partitioning protein
MVTMATESRGLGRGLGALLGATPTVSASRGGGTLPIALMQPGAFQPRHAIHQQPLEELAASIKANGVIEPIIVRALPAASAGAARYEIVAGERRWRAAQLAGLTDIPTIVRPITDRQAVAIALIENIQREDLTAAEEARALKRLIEEFSLSHQEAADAVGRSRVAVSNLIRLLDLPGSVVDLIDSKALNMGQARALLGLAQDAERVRVAELVVQRALSVRETERLVADVARRAGRPGVAPKTADDPAISEVLRTPGVRVELQQKAAGSGTLIVEFKDPQTRDALLAAIKAAAAG